MKKKNVKKNIIVKKKSILKAQPNKSAIKKISSMSSLELKEKIKRIKMVCSCKQEYYFYFFIEQEFNNLNKVPICYNCHPFFTGASKFIDEKRKIYKFTKKFNYVSILKEKNKKILE